MRANDRPPAEELLVALAHLEAKQPEEAAKWHAQAVAWLDRYQPPMQVLLGGVWSGSAQVLKSQLDPRYNAFGLGNVVRMRSLPRRDRGEVEVTRMEYGLFSAAKRLALRRPA